MPQEQGDANMQRPHPPVFVLIFLSNGVRCAATATDRAQDTFS
jgi:hypothetical protein